MVPRGFYYPTSVLYIKGEKDMKKLIGVSVLFSVFCCAANNAYAGYTAIAIGGVGGGLGLATGKRTMNEARAAALKECNSSGDVCTKVTAEDDSWYFSAGYCDGVPYTAASRKSFTASDALVFRKGALEGHYHCYIETEN
jgi:hypothetical protein